MLPLLGKPQKQEPPIFISPLWTTHVRKKISYRRPIGTQGTVYELISHRRFESTRRCANKLINQELGKVALFQCAIVYKLL